LLWEHVDWLRASAARFDDGHISESKRIAVAVRTLVHDTAVSRSLLGQLGVRDRMTWLSAAGRGKPPWTFDPKTPGFRHRGLADAVDLDFEIWWRGELLPLERASIDRSWLVLNVANFDGGAHVDPQLPAEYRAVSRDGELHPHRVNSAGTLYRDTTDPIPWGLRTICSEVIASIERAEIP
jgi:hypothetical protein